jgi:hypothetical protein
VVSSTPICSECNGKGHDINECPKKKKEEYLNSLGIYGYLNRSRDRSNSTTSDRSRRNNSTTGGNGNQQ